jgi:hypothetical protein
LTSHETPLPRGVVWNIGNIRIYPDSPLPLGGGPAPNLGAARDPLAGVAAGLRQEVPYRSRMETAFGTDFSSVRALTGQAGPLIGIQAQAAATAETVAFASPSPAPELVAHELAHVVQRRRQGDAPYQGSSGRSRPGDPAELEADRAAGMAVRGERVQIRETPRTLVSLSPLNPFDDPRVAANEANAKAALDAYQKLPEPTRRAAVAASYKTGNIIRMMLSQLSMADQSSTYGPVIREITRWAEELETRASAGLTDDQIAAEQAAFMQKLNEDRAKKTTAAKAPKGKPAPVPTKAEIEQARKETIKEGASYRPQTVTGWDGLTKAEQAAWTLRGNSAITTVVAYAKLHYPELGLTAANLKLDFKGIEQVGANAVAAGSPALIGRSFVETVELNPAYVMDVLVHEIYGHPAYGTYGTEYHMVLYDLAAAKQPGYVQPPAGSDERKLELANYAYQETEIFAVLRSVPYRTAPSAADAAKVPNLDSQTLVNWHVGEIKKQWSPKLIVAILRGLRRRLLLDPRITPAAFAIFDKALGATCAAADVAKITAP